MRHSFLYITRNVRIYNIHILKYIPQKTTDCIFKIYFLQQKENLSSNQDSNLEYEFF